MQEINMVISGIIRKKSEKYVRVSFQRNQDTAEYILPECKLDKSKGFNEKELGMLKDYLLGNKADIMEHAKKINPMKAMLGLKEK